MITTYINVFDAGVLGIMLMSCLFAALRGFVREVLSLSAWIGAGLVTLYYFPAFAERLKPHFKSDIVAAGFATLGIYIIALMGFSLINMIILRFLKEGSEVGVLDNLLGLVFGAFRGALIISLGFFLVTIGLPEREYPSWMSQSITLPYVEKGAVLLAKIAPEYLRDISSLEEKAKAKIQDEETSQPAAAPQAVGNGSGDNSAGVGYDQTTQEQLNKLLNGTSGNGQ